MCQCKPGYDFCPDGDGGMACVDEQTDSDNCSACGKACTSPLSCGSGKCACVLSLTVADCDGQCADLTSDPNHCGGCQPQDVCGPAQSCESMDGGLGTCQCSDSSLTGCPSGCVDLTSDPFNCGCCGNTCLPGDAGGSLMCLVDNGGSCDCPGTLQECGTAANPTCGLCTDTNWDANNCGGCGQECFASGAPVTCDAGDCFCGDAGTNIICPDFSCPNFDTDPNNCGGCANVCASTDAPVTCRGGMCFCGDAGTGTICPDGTCPDFNTDVRNCGGCAMPCFEPTPLCTAGHCADAGS
jgi:hypothetical protein